MEAGWKENDDTGRIKAEIRRLKEETRSTILSHYYQVLDIHDVADQLGDSLGLSRAAAKEKDAQNIIFAAVDFMAEVAKLLSPDRRVFLPAAGATCPMANRLSGATVREYKENYPGLPVILYVNTLAEAKAECDVICTSANSVEVCSRVAKDTGNGQLLMGPDANLAYHVAKKTGLGLITMPERGCCIVHDQFVIEDVELLRSEHPGALLVVHPECKPEVQEAADYVGSTSQMLKFIAGSSHGSFIIGTERGLVERLEVDHPGKEFHSLAPTATGGICRNMKKTSLASILDILQRLASGDDKALASNEITIDPAVASPARKAIDAMFELTG